MSSPASRSIAPVDAADPRFRAALSRARLPVDDLDTAVLLVRAVVEDGAPLAFAALEGSGADRLMRSVVVGEAARGRGLARALVEALAAEAAVDGARRLWLLTTDAAEVFARLGWRRIARAEAPAAIAAHPQMVGLCPASAVCMVREIGARADPAATRAS